ncbi:MAG: LexA family protein [Candidatus Nucleicultricaceae bacterium]
MTLQANCNNKILIYTPSLDSFMPLPYLVSSSGPEKRQGQFFFEKPALDLNEFVIKNKDSTFFARISGDAMIGSGILSGDLLVVDRSIPLANHKIIVAILGHEVLVRRYVKHPEGIVLHADHPLYPPYLIGNNRRFQVWGVVTNVIRPL